MKYIEYEITNHLAIITLNRPEKRNSFSYDLVTELKQAFHAAEHHPEVKAVILKASGKVFSAGADLAYLQSLQNASYQENLTDSIYLKDLYIQIYKHSKPVIAQVQGHAIAGGCGLVTACDFVFAVPEAEFGYTEVKIGFIPAIVMTFLIRKVGEARAKSLLLSGDLVSAQTLADFGLIHEIVPASKLSHKVYEFAQHLITTNSLQAMGVTKKLIAEIQEKPLFEALSLAAEMNAQARGLDDCKKGIQAFLNKEKIKW